MLPLEFEKTVMQEDENGNETEVVDVSNLTLHEPEKYDLVEENGITVIKTKAKETGKQSWLQRLFSEEATESFVFGRIPYSVSAVERAQHAAEENNKILKPQIADAENELKIAKTSKQATDQEIEALQENLDALQKQVVHRVNYNDIEAVQTSAAPKVKKTQAPKA